MTREKIRRSLRYSVMDGAFFSAMVGFGESFFSAFGVFLQATSIQLGLLDALPKALGALSQLYTSRIVAFFKSRKWFVCILALIEGLFYIPIALAYYYGSLKVALLIALVSVYWLLGNIIAPAWTSWIGDLTEDVNRGSYFGKRNRIAGIVSLASLFLAGFILQRFDGGLIGFMAIFGLAMFARIMSFVYLSRTFDPPTTYSKKDPFSFIEFMREARKTNFGMFTIYSALMNFAVYFVAPFFAAYLLNDVGLDYWSFTLIIGVGMLAKLASMPIWGWASDKWGSRKTLALAGLTMPIVPVLFLFSNSFEALVLIQLVSGFTWAGFDLAVLNFTFDSTRARNRSTCVAYYNALNGVAILAGALVASLIIKYVTFRNGFFWSAFSMVFLISFILRYAVSFIFLPRLKERRKVEDIGYHQLFLRIVTKLPAVDTVYGLMIFPARRLDKSFKKTAKITKKGLEKLR